MLPLWISSSNAEEDAADEDVDSNREDDEDEDDEDDPYSILNSANNSHDASVKGRVSFLEMCHHDHPCSRVHK